VRFGRVPRVLHAHSRILALCSFRIESTKARDGERARADSHAEAGGSPSQASLKWLTGTPGDVHCAIESGHPYPESPPVSSQAVTLATRSPSPTGNSSDRVHSPVAGSASEL
jgi:hypothetical protein